MERDPAIGIGAMGNHASSTSFARSQLTLPLSRERATARNGPRILVARHVHTSLREKALYQFSLDRVHYGFEAIVCTEFLIDVV